MGCQKIIPSSTMVTYHLGHTFICFPLMLYGTNLGYVELLRYFGFLDSLMHPSLTFYHPGDSCTLINEILFLGVLPLLKTRNQFNQRCPCIVFECFLLFQSIKCCLESLSLTHALHHAYPTLIYDQACFTCVHMAIQKFEVVWELIGPPTRV